MKPAFVRANRRQCLFGTISAMASLGVPLLLRAASASGMGGAFLDVSQRLMNPDLNPAIGARIAASAATRYRDLAGMLAQITAAADARNSACVEDVFDNLPEGPTRDFAYWVIVGWFTASSFAEREATLFTNPHLRLFCAERLGARPLCH
ncbi:hypothetical protein F3W81_06610 [Pseudooceanicola spongiae]|uniref:Uncharacterized protein n=2 Tax=Pseudooceanicola spongiae TaxID=2613965 RepID=A0A7L9WJV3_9RHOB|nr:hypothetical protein F3W81_06610 [Pseudooceanicola spongiae]